MPIIEGTTRVKTAVGEYDFAVDGGVVGTINLRGEGVPKDAVVTGGYIEVLTVPTSAGAATLSAGLEAAADLADAAVISGAPWSTTGLKSVDPASTGATAFKTTAARRISVVVGTADLTAGKLRVVLRYQ